MTGSVTPVRTFAVDKAHSELTFQVRHLITRVRGRFRDFQGTIHLDEAHPERSTVSFAVDAASIDTSEKDRDTHLRSEDFFFVDTFPTITFASTAIAPRGDDRFDLTGWNLVREVAVTYALGARKQLVHRPGNRPCQPEPHAKCHDLDDQEQAADPGHEDEQNLAEIEAADLLERGAGNAVSIVSRSAVRSKAEGTSPPASALIALRLSPP